MLTQSESSFTNPASIRRQCSWDTKVRGPVPAALETGKVLTVSVHGAVTARDRGACCWEVAPQSPGLWVTCGRGRNILRAGSVPASSSPGMAHSDFQKGGRWGAVETCSSIKRKVKELQR